MQQHFQKSTTVEPRNSEDFGHLAIAGFSAILQVHCLNSEDLVL